jgi:hypothetical protein
VIYYACLRETRPIKDISDLSGATSAAPATIRIHALHVSDGQIACPYARKDGDVAEPDRDWFDDILPGEVPCEDCLAAIQPAKG